MIWNPGADGEVRRLIVDGNTIYAAGDFHTIGGFPRHYIAALDSKTGGATSWNPLIDEPTFSLTISGDTVYVAGEFNTVDRKPRTNFAVLLAKDH